MKKYIFLLALLLSGCTEEVLEQGNSILTDSTIEIPAQPDLTLPKNPDIFNNLKEHIPEIEFPPVTKNSQTEAILEVMQPYGIDGDTITGIINKQALLDSGIPIAKLDGQVLGANFNVKIRYLLIDAPESAHPEKGVQPFAVEAKNRNSELLLKGPITIQFDNGEKIDKYGRLIAYVYNAEGMIQKTLIQEGYGRVAYVYEPNTTHLKSLDQAQKMAKKKGQNIWSIPMYAENRFEQ